MSLKAFHVFFVTASTIVTGLFAFWCFREFEAAGRPLFAIGGAAAVVATIALAVYETVFLRRFKEIGFF